MENKTCPNLCTPGREFVLARFLDPRRHDSDSTKTRNDCGDLKKGSGPWLAIGGTDFPGSGTLAVDENNMLKHDYLMWCTTEDDSAICARTDYPTTDDAKTTCCLNTNPDTFGPNQCDPKYCSDSNTMSLGCQDYLIQKMSEDPEYAATNYEAIKLRVPRDQIVNSYIKLCSNPKNLTSVACANFCNDPVFNSSTTSPCTDIIKKYCSDKTFKNDPNDPDQKICGCFYKDVVYDNYYKSLNEKLQIPPGVLVNKRQCFFPACEASPYHPDSNDQCQNLDIVNCIQDVKVNNQGTITGNVNVKSTAECKNITTRGNQPIPSPPSPPSPPGPDPNPPPYNPPVPDDNPTPSKKPSFWNSLPGYLTIAGIVLFVFILFIVLFVVLSSQPHSDDYPQQNYYNNGTIPNYYAPAPSPSYV